MENYYLYMLFEANQEEITWWAMSIRGIILIVYGILLIKIGGKRIFSAEGSFDIVLSIMMGALLAKAIAGNGKFIPILAATFSMALFHKLLSKLSFVNQTAEKFFKGRPEKIIENGRILKEELEKHKITELDLKEALRRQSQSNNLDDIKEAHVEASGKISILLK